MLLRSLLAAVLVALVLAAPAAAAPPRDWLGVTADGPLTAPGASMEGEWDVLAGSGAASVRTAFYWWDGQPSGPGALAPAAYDRVVLAAAQRGLGVLPVVQGTPTWAAADPGNYGAVPRDPGDFARFLVLLEARFGRGGSFWAEHPEVQPQPIRMWQIWNEPNLTRYWTARPFAPSYVRLLRAAASALRGADRGAKVLLAGLPNRSWTALRAIYRAGGRRAFDAVALHPYTGQPVHVVKLVQFARRVMQRFGDRRKPAWITELSWPASEGKADAPLGFETTDRGQATRLRSTLQRLAAKQRVLRLRRIYWYTWLSAEGGVNAFNWSGLRRVRNGQVVSAPALTTFRNAAKRLRR
jgi:hypothetical protein